MQTPFQDYIFDTGIILVQCIKQEDVARQPCESDGHKQKNKCLNYIDKIILIFV